jgi:hypothetical protein
MCERWYCTKFQHSGVYHVLMVNIDFRTGNTIAVVARTMYVLLTSERLLFERMVAMFE